MHVLFSYLYFIVITLGGNANCLSYADILILILWHLSPSWPWRHCPPQGCQSLEMAKDLPFTCKWNNPGPHPSHLLMVLSWSEPLTPCPKHLKASARHWGQPLCPSAHWNYANRQILSLLILPHLFFSMETTTTALARIFLLRLPPPDWPCCSPRWPCMACCTPSSRNCE